ncbi:ABC transporter permease [Brevibacillus fluminis]|uniref:ABC transporter permease n=1 Tax=Brevibacillus fluminis TaxID=511487 RepID=A0A3M8DB98_9BACL|nr:ABC transporter permease [Brevibacillus fluminis]RNB84585.1 ABC transporter permease [Brevibacillus fluminis]
MKMFVSQCKMELLRLVRNKRFYFMSLGFPILFYMIFSSTVGENAEVGGTVWKAYYLISMTAFGLINASINSLAVKMSQERAQGLVRLLQITPLSPRAYIGAKILALSIVNLGVIVAMFLTGYFVKGVSLAPMQWIGCGIWLWAGSLIFLALGSLIGSSRKAEIAQILCTVLQLGLSLTGGLWMPVQSMPEVMREIAFWTPTFHFASGAWELLAGHAPGWGNAMILAAYLIVFVIGSSYVHQKQEAV